MSIINRNEIRRLEKAAREKDKKHLIEWANSLEKQMVRDIVQDLEKRYQQDIQDAWDNLLIATAYTLHFSEETNLDADTLPSFMEDLYATIDMYRTGEYNPKDYEEELNKCGVVIEKYDYQKIYKDYIGTLDSDLVSFIKGPRRKIITICGDYKYKDKMMDIYKELTLQGNIVFLDTLFIDNDADTLDRIDIIEINKIQKDKILLSDAIYVVNINNYIGESTKLEIEYAKEHNKEIIYLEQ